jgi:hypothetical protein
MPGTHENGSARLDRLEGLMAMLIEDHVQFREEHKLLLSAQVLLTERVDKLAVTLDTAIKELSAAQRHTDERLNALIAVVDHLVRHRPPQ